MTNFTLIALCLSSITLYHFSYGQGLGNFDSYSRLETRLNSLNSSFQQQQKQLDVIISDIIIQQNSQEDDITGIKAQLKTVQGKVAALEKTTKENSDLITSASVQLIAVELGFEELSNRMDKLDSTNQLWRSNFQVVNRTFAELKKKFAYVIPG